jgi:predicted acylesterase/phospholipase RssA/CRP-like cAMP-binding protein
VIHALSAADRKRLQHELLEATLPRWLGPLDESTFADLRSRISWRTIRRGTAPFQQGEPADGWYVVASGRLVLVRREPDGRETTLGEVGRGDSLGETALLAGAAHEATPYAVRETDLLYFPRAELEELLERHPRVALSIARAAVRRSLGAREAARAPTSVNIAVVPAHPGAAVASLVRALTASLARLGSTLHVTPSRADELGRMGEVLKLPDGHPGWRALSAWLEERAAEHRFLVLEAGAFQRTWARRALAEADHVLLVADARHPPSPHALELDLLAPSGGRFHAQRTLVLLHPPGTTLPRGTARWLDARDVQHHQHVRHDRRADVDRLARTLAGEAVSLVLGAGGARGLAHIGVLRALAEADVPVDHVGGASIGAMIGALHAMGRTPDEIAEMAKSIAATRPFFELALPITSLVRGRRVEHAARMAFGDTTIEDLWVPFFCNSCDLTSFRDIVHERGELAPAILASGALPGVLPPRPWGRQLLVDGGTTYMLPGALMRARSRGPMIAVDVSPERELECAPDPEPTSWASLWRRLRSSEPRAPTANEVFWRSVGFLSTQRTAEVARDAELFLQPRVERSGTVELDSLPRIVELGYHHARERLATFRIPGSHRR